MINGSLPDQILLLTWDLSNLSLEEFEELTQKTSIHEQRIREILDKNSSSGFFVLKTCQRIIFMTWSQVRQYRAIIKEIEKLLGTKITSRLLSFRGSNAFYHLANIASSLDSLVLGEPQILGQVRDAYKVAVDRKQLRPPLEFVIREAVRSAKKVFRETSLPKGKISFLSLLEDEISFLKSYQRPLHIALFGTGDMAKNTIALLKRVSSKIYLDVYTNRQELVVRKLHAENSLLSDRIFEDGEVRLLLVNQFYDRELPPYDAIFLATDRTAAFFTQKDVLRVKNSFQDPDKHLLIIDLGMPRNSDPNVAKIENVKLLQVSDLMERAKHAEKQRKQAIRHAKPIIYSQAVQLNRKLFIFLEQERILNFRRDLENALTKRKTQLLEVIDKDHQNSKLDRTLERVFHEILHISQKHFEKALMEGKP